jgi:hypothetical protein
LNSSLVRIIIVTAGIGAAVAVSAATMSFDPYVPGEGKGKIAADLAIPVADVAVDRRCVYTRTDHWVASTTPKSMSTCTVLATPTRLILANYDKDSGAYVVDLSFDYAQIKSVALSAKDGFDTSVQVDGKKQQLQLETDQGFISVSAWRTPPKVKPFDARGSEDLFEVVKSKGVAVAEPKGLVEVEIPTFTLFRHK